jgi:hypothetical protein
MAEARAAFDHRDYARTIAVLERVEQPSPEMHGLAGRAYYELGDYRRAAGRFEKAAAGEPDEGKRLRWARLATESSRQFNVR